MKLKQTLLFLLFLVCTNNLTHAEKFRVSTPEACQKAVDAGKAGDEIIIANGSYSGWQVEVRTSGSAGKPLIIRGETTGKVIFTGEVSKPVFLISGNYVELQTIVFSQCVQVKTGGGSGFVIELRETKHSRVRNCAFTRITTKAQFVPIFVVSGNGDNNRIDHCQFSKNIDNQEVQVKITANEIPQHTLIDNNTFHDKQKVSWQNSNGGECVQIGQDPILLGNQASYTIVRENTFTACNGEPEVISNKSSGNSYVKNSFNNCQGELVMRGGHDCTINGNIFNGGSGGVRVSGSHHTITNNKMNKLPIGIRLMYGMSKGKDETGFYVAASDCTIRNNMINDCKTGILIGDSKNADWTGKFDVNRYPSRTMQDVAPFNNNIEDNRISGTATPILHNEN